MKKNTTISSRTVNKTSTTILTTVLLLIALIAPSAINTLLAQTPNGTESNPYPIKTKAHLTTLAERVNAGGDFYFDPADSTYKTSGDAQYKISAGGYQAYFKLVDDIVFNSGDVASCDGVKADTWTEWIPIGVSGNLFDGTFDGGFHTVSGIFLKASSDAGFFGATQNHAVIKNLGVVNSYIANTGANTGGILGSALGSTVEKCFFAGTLETSSHCTGGIAGQIQSGTTISTCYASATINTTGSQVGGIVGNVDAGTPASTIQNVYSSCVLHGLYAYTGGVVGDNTFNNANFTNCAYDKQLVDLKNNTPYGPGTAMETADMTTGSWTPGSGFSNVAGGGYYPYITGFTVNNNIVLSLTPVFLPTTTTLSDLTSVTAVTLGGSSQNVVWTEEERVGIGSLSGTTLDVPGQAYVVLKATIDQNSRVYVLRFDKEPMLGAESNPFTIDNYADLTLFRDGINSGTSFAYKHFTVPALGVNTFFLQTQDISMPNFNWTSVGNKTDLPFQGTYDGGDNTISGWKTGTDGTAFFRYTENATIKNLTLDNIRSGADAAAAAALIYSMRGGTVDNCHATGSSSGIKGGLIFATATGDYTCYIKNSTNSNSFTQADRGGIVSSVGATTNYIDNCHNYGNLTGDTRMGGIVGRQTLNTTPQTFITNCSNCGNIKATGKGDFAHAGGILGQYEVGRCTIENCSNKGNIQGYYNIAAGISAYNLAAITVTKCYNTGTVTGGGSTSDQSITVYGIAPSDCKVSKCFNAGKVINKSIGAAYGICGTSDNISDCFNAGDVYAGNGSAYSITGGTNTYVIARVIGHESSVASTYYDPARVPSFSTGASTAKSTTEMTSGSLSLNDNWEQEAGRYPRIKELANLTISKAISLPITFGAATDNVDNVTANFTIAKDYGIDWRITGTSGATIADQGTNAKLITLPADRTGGNIVLEAFVGDTVFYTIELKMGVTAPDTDLTVQNYTDLKALRDGINSGTTFKYHNVAVPAGAVGTTFKVTSDFSILPSDNWVPIGTETNPFKGTFDGDNHTLSQMRCTQVVVAGLFGYVDGGKVKNLTLDKVNITKSNFSGGVCAVLRKGEIRNCNVKGSITGGTTSYYTNKYLGGIVALAYQNSKIVKCTNYATVSSSNGKSSYTAGIVAVCQNTGTHVDTCINAGNVSLSRYTAGICAYSGTITACINYGEVTGMAETKLIGGISVSSSSSTIKSCVNSGRVAVPGMSASCTVAGISAYSSDAAFSNTGCINAGYISGSNATTVVGISNGSVSYCINVGQVAGTGSVHAVKNGTSTKSFYDSQMCTATDASATAKTTTEMCGNSLKTDLTNIFVYEDNMYPRVKGIDTLAPSLAISSPVFLSNGENVEMVENNFTTGGCDNHNVIWTTDVPTCLGISSCSVEVKNPGLPTLMAGIDTVYKKVYLKVNMDAFVIKDSLQLVNFRIYFNTWQDNTNTFYYNPSDSTYHARTDYQAGYVAVPMFGEGATFRLAKDISLGGTEWVPIADKGGNNKLVFKGTFDGNGHTISNFKLKNNTSAYKGLFGYAADAVFKDLTVDNVSGTGLSVRYVGGLCGSAEGCSAVNVTISNVNVKSIITDTDVEQSYIGALAGYTANIDLKNVNVENCVVEGNKPYIGGVAGDMIGGSKMNHCRVFKCVVTGASTVGGVTGYMAHGTNSTTVHSYVWVDSCTVSGVDNVGGYTGNHATVPGGSHRYIYVRGGSVTGTGKQVGGLFGFAGSATLHYSINTATVSGNKEVAGIVGRGRFGSINDCKNEGDVTGSGNYVGGILAITDDNKAGVNTSVTGCVNSGHITGNNYVGGIRGYSFHVAAPAVQTSVNLGEVEGNMYVGGILGENRGDCYYCVNVGQIHGASYVGGIVGMQTQYPNSDARYTRKCYSAGQVWGDENVGNVAGGYDDGTIKNCYYDKQMSPNYKGVGTLGDDVTTDDAAVGKLTSEMLGTALSSGLGDNFTFTSDLYPRITTIKDSLGSLVAAAPAVLPDNNLGNTVTAYTIPGDRFYTFTPSTANSVVWNRNGISLEKTNADFKPAAAGRCYLTANIGSISKKLDFVVGVSKELPCVIKNQTELEKFTQFVNSGTTFYYQTTDSTFRATEPGDLLAGITVKPGGEEAFFKLYFDPEYGSGETWAGRIGTTEQPFLGDFNGNGHTVKGLSSATTDTCGFFGYNAGTIYDLTIEDAEMTDASHNVVGALCGYNTGNISNCHVINGEVNGTNYVGGMVGLNNGYVENGHNSATVNGSQYVGGLVGSNTNTVRNCFNMGDVTASATSDTYLGGVAGQSTKTLINSYNAGNVTATGASSAYVGGVVGRKTGSTFANCYNAGQVVAPTEATAGGVAGASNNTLVNSLAYDIQACSLPNAYGAGNGNANANATTNMTGTALQSVLGTENWTYTDNLYPRLTIMESTEASIVSATPVVLEGGENVADVKHDFSVVTDNSVQWSVDPTTTTNALNMDNLPAVTLNRCGTPTLLAKLGTDGKEIKNVPLSISYTANVLHEDTVCGGSTYTWSINGVTYDASRTVIFNTLEEGCQVIHTLNLVIPDELQLDLSSTDEQCYQAEDGTATATVTGGFGQYEYDWQNEGGTTVATTAVASNLAPGKYTVKVIDKKPVPEDGVSYCFVEGEVTIAPAEELKFKLDTFYAGCYNSNNGMFQVSVEGGMPSYVLSWKKDGVDAGTRDVYTAQDNFEVNSLPNGTYEVTITDDHNCSITLATFDMVNVSDQYLVTAYSEEKTYDGEPLNAGRYTLKIGSGTPEAIASGVNKTLPNGDVLTVEVQQSTCTDAGEYPNAVTSCKVMRGTDDVTCSYNFSIVDGLVSIAKRSVTVTSADSVNFSNKVDCIDRHEVTVTPSDGFVAAEAALITYDYTGQLCNSQPEEMVSNTFSINWNGVNENNYDVTINYGTLALLTNGLLFVKAVGVEKTYDAVPVNVNQNINESYNIIAYYIRENVTPGVNDTIYYTMGSGNTIIGASGIEYTVNVVMNDGNNFTVLNADTVENAVTSVSVTTSGGENITGSFTKVVKDTALIQINPIEITLTSYDGEWTYDGEPHSRTGVSVEGSFLTGDLQDAPAANTEVTTYGTYTNTITYTLASGVNPVNYKVTKNEGSLVINKRPLYLRGVDKLVDYQSGVTQYTDVFTYDNLLVGHTASGISYRAEGESVGDHTGVFSGTLLVEDAAHNDVTENYNPVEEPGILGIQSPNALLKIKSATQSHVYDGTAFTAQTYEVNYKGVRVNPLATDPYRFRLSSGDTVEVIPVGTGITGRVDVGSVKNSFTHQIHPLANHALYTNLEGDTGTVSVTTRPVTLTSGSLTRDYDGTAIENNTVDVSGSLFVGEEGVESYSFDNPGTWITVGEYNNTFTYTLKSNTNPDNYEITPVAGLLKINKNVLTVTADNKTRKYGETVEYTCTITGYKGGDDESVITGLPVTCTSPAGQFSNIGNYDIIPDISGLSADNYTFEAVKGKLTIEKRPLTVSARTASVEYDGVAHNQTTNPPTSVTYTNLATNDAVNSIAWSYERIPGGLEPMNVSSIQIYHNDGGNIDVTNNYTVTTDDESKLEITKKKLKIMVDNATKEYDGTELVPSSYKVDATDTLAVGDNIVNVIYTGSQTEVGTSTGSINTTEMRITNPLVPYDVFVSSYTLTLVDGTLEVTGKEMVLTVDNVSKVYDGTPLTTTATVTGYLGSTEPTLEYAVKADDTGDWGAWTATAPSRTQAGVTYAKARATLTNHKTAEKEYTITVTPNNLPIVITSGDRDFAYDGTQHSFPSYTLTYNGVDISRTAADSTKFLLPTGDVLSVTNAATITNYNENAPNNNTFSYVIENGNSYDPDAVTQEYGTIAITAYGQPLKVKSLPQTWVFDNTAHNYKHYQVYFDNVEVTTVENDTVFTLPTGDKLTFTNAPSITNVGKVANTFTYTLENDIRYIGVRDTVIDTLVVTPLTGVEVTIKEKGGITYYDGYLQQVKGYTVESISSSLYQVSDFKFKDSAPASDTIVAGRYVGTYYMLLKGEDFENLNPNFAGVIFTIVDSSLVIKPNQTPITVTASSASKPYDGQPLTSPNYSYTQNVLAMGDTLVATVSGTITNFGTEDNVVTEYKVLRNETAFNAAMMRDGLSTVITNPAGYDKDVTDCYTFTEPAVQKGILEITPNGNVTVEITGNTGEFNYDGNVHSVHNYVAVITDTLGIYVITDFNFTGDSTLDETAVGTYQMNLANTQFVNTNANYDPVTFTVVEDGWMKIYEALSITKIDTDSVSCYGLNDGSATVTISGGKPGSPRYHYEVTGVNTHDTYNGDVDAEFTLTGLKPDRYEVTITDLLSYTLDTAFSIGEPDTLVVVVTTPVNHCPNSDYYDVSLTTSGGNGGNQYEWGVDATDANTTATVVARLLSNDCGHEYTAAAKVTDRKGCEATDTASFTVIDNEKPKADMPADLTVCRNSSTGEIEAPTSVTGEPENLSDNCTNVSTLSVTRVDLDTTGTDSEPRIIHRQWTVTDQCGNDSIKVQNITVRPSILTPGNYELTCPADVTETLNYNECEMVVNIGTPTVVNHMTDMDVTVTNDAPAGNIFHEGTTTVTWTATDECGAFLTCTQTITVNFPPCGTTADSVADFNGIKYSSVRVGCQCWTGENLRSTNYTDGTAVADYHNYNSDPAYDTVYGKLYSWYSANRVPEGDDEAVPTSVTGPTGPYVQGICPDGWALPSSDDYRTLFTTAGLVDYLKDTDAKYWLPGAAGITPSTGFDARGAGILDSDIHRYMNLLGETYYWTSELAPTTVKGHCAVITYYCPEGIIQEQMKGHGQSVRCIRMQ